MKNVSLKIQTITLLVLVAFSATCLLTTTGCEFKNPFAKKDGPASRPPLENDDAENFQGHFLTVKIDSYQTEKLKIEGNEQIWTILEASSTPKILFKMDENKLGPLKTATININPLINGKPDLKDIWKYSGKDKITAGMEIQLNLFNHFFDDKMIAGVKELPAGKYRLSLHVVGEDSWDRQNIDFEIK